MRLMRTGAAAALVLLLATGEVRAAAGTAQGARTPGTERPAASEAPTAPAASPGPATSEGARAPGAPDAARTARRVLAAVNAHRTRHGVPALELSPVIGAHAQEWAGELAERDVLTVRPGNRYGENVAAFSGPPVEDTYGEAAVRRWYACGDDYPAYGREPAPGELTAEHAFTQLVWATGREMGVGIATAESGRVFVVADFDPPGNVRGRYAANVPPPA